MLDRFSLKQKFILNGAVSGFLLLAIGLIFSFIMNKVLVDVNSLIRHPYAVQLSLANIKIKTLEIQKGMKDAVITNDQAKCDEACAVVDSFDAAILHDFKTLSERFLGDKKRVDDLIMYFEKWKEVRNKIRKSIELHDREMSYKLTTTEGQKAIDEFFRSFELIQHFAEEKTLGFSTSVVNNIRLSQKVVVIFLIVSLLFSGFFTYYISRQSSVLEGIIGIFIEAKKMISTSSSEGAQLSSQLKESAQMQSKDLQKTSSALEEITAMASQNESSSNSAKKLTEINESETDRGTQSVENVLKAVNEINTANENIFQNIEKNNADLLSITDIISEIESKTKVINDIVFQTRLLSFNASVEAARAGDHGKGFAVVAEEVRNLADLSGNAAASISELLSKSSHRVEDIIKKTSKEISELTIEAKDKTTSGLDAAKECMKVLEKLAESAKSINETISNIAVASTEQGVGVREINQSIQNISSSVNEITQLSESTNNQALALNKESFSLTNAVDTLSQFVFGKNKQKNLES